MLGACMRFFLLLYGHPNYPRLNERSKASNKRLATYHTPTPRNVMASLQMFTPRQSTASFAAPADLSSSDLLADKRLNMRREAGGQAKIGVRHQEELIVAALPQDPVTHSRTQLHDGKDPSDLQVAPGSSVAAPEAQPKSAVRISISSASPQKESQSCSSARATTPEGTIQRAHSLTKNTISPIVKGTPKSSSSTTRSETRDLWPEPKPVSQGFEHYERIVAQRDAKIGLLQKQVDVLKATLREKGLVEAEKTLAGLLSSNDNSRSQFNQLQVDLDDARRELEREQAAVGTLKKKQAEDIQELRNMHERVVNESAEHQMNAERLEEMMQHKDDVLLMWQRSHGELEAELDRTVVKLSQLQGARDTELEDHTKEADSFHKRFLESTKAHDAVRKDRDNLVAELNELKAVMAGHEGVVGKMQDARREDDTARHRLLQELESAQSEANSLRQEVVALQAQAMSHQTDLKHEAEMRRQVEQSLEAMTEAKTQLEVGCMWMCLSNLAHGTDLPLSPPDCVGEKTGGC